MSPARTKAQVIQLHASKPKPQRKRTRNHKLHKPKSHLRQIIKTLRRIMKEM